MWKWSNVSMICVENHVKKLVLKQCLTKHMTCCERMFIAQKWQETNWKKLKLWTRKTCKPKHTRGSNDCVHQLIFWQNDWSTCQWNPKTGQKVWCYDPFVGFPQKVVHFPQPDDQIIAGKLINYCGRSPLLHLASCCETELPSPCPDDHSKIPFNVGMIIIFSTRIPLPR